MTTFPFHLMPEAMTTTRLRLRTPVAADASRIAMFIGDWDVVKMLARPPYPYCEVDAVQWIASLKRENGAHYAIVHANGVVGVVGLDASNKTDVELGYWLAKPFWGRGLMTEAAGAVVAAARACAPRGAICTGHFADNAGSRRVIQKLGFVKSADSVLHSVARGADAPHVSYRLPVAVHAAPPVLAPA
jgi:RimJ/RimL family protein N-acetyltransferase